MEVDTPAIVVLAAREPAGLGGNNANVLVICADPFVVGGAAGIAVPVAVAVFVAPSAPGLGISAASQDEGGTYECGH